MTPTMTPPNRKTILAIDDTPENLMTLGAALEEEYEVVMATSGQEGLELVQSMRPDLILLDVMMPGMDGYETCQRIRSIPENQRIPVVFVTAMGDSGSEMKGLEMGGADYLSKPLNVPIVRQRIRNLLERESLRQELQRQRDHLEELVQERTQGLQVAKEAAEAASRVKSTLLSNLGHEFRTPMSTILGFIHVIRREADHSRQMQFLDKLEQGAQQLSNTLNRLIDLSLAQSRQIQLAPTAFNAGTLAGAVANACAKDAQAKGLALQLDISTLPSDGPQCLGDVQRLELILKELVGNAIKFSTAGQITLSARLQGDAQPMRWLEVAVADQGVGIDASAHEAVFEAFEQVDASSTRSQRGTGIGLALSRQLARQMGGDITLASAAGQGSTFTLRVPAVQPD